MSKTTDGNFVNNIINEQKENLQELGNLAKDRIDSIAHAKEKIAKHKGKAEEDVTVSEMGRYVLKNIDIYEMAESHPKAVSGTWKMVSDGLALVNPYCVVPAALVNLLDDNLAATIVKYSAFPSAEHVLRMGINLFRKKQTA